MRFGQLILVLTGMGVVGGGFADAAWAFQDYGDQGYEVYPLEARVWLDRGAEPVLQRGERVRIYYRVSESAFVAIFHIDTNGTARMVFPSSPQENHYARGGRDYRILFPGSTYWYVNDDPGVGYFFIVASPEPFDFRDFSYSHYTGGWDLSLVGSQVYGDPYLAMDDYVAALIPDWEYVAYGLDFTSYHVERHHDYPRFLCYDCHGFQPYYSWNPYAYSCTSFRVVIYSDPYYYPSSRYRGTRVVFVQPRRGIPRYGFKERAVGEPGTPNIVVRNTPPVSQPGVEGAQNRRAVPRASAPSVFDPGGNPGNPPGTSGVGRPGVESGASRRPNTAGGIPSVSTGRPTGGQTGSLPSTGTAPRTIRTDPAGGRSSGVTRPSSRVRNPGGGGGVVTPSAPTRTSPTVRSGGTTTRTTPTVRSGGTTTRTSPTVRSGGSSGGSKPTVRSSGGGTQSRPAVRSGGASGRASPPTTRPTGPPKVRKPGGGGLS